MTSLTGSSNNLPSEVPWQKVVDAMIYCGVIDDEAQLNHLVSVRFGVNGVDVDKFLVDEDGNHNVSMNGTIQKRTFTIPYSYEDEPEESPDE